MLGLSEALHLDGGVVDAVLSSEEVCDQAQSLQGGVRLNVGSQGKLAHTNGPQVEIMNLLYSFGVLDF
jgi:hypothetical protein